MVITAETYKAIYKDKHLKYGQAEHDRCPGVRYFPRYMNWICSPVLDLGCGTGDTVRLLKRNCFLATGYDWIPVLPEVGQQADITEPLPMILLLNVSSSICIDVFEHVDDRGITGILKNLARTNRQAITVHTGSHVVHGVELHINQKPVEEWRELIGQYLKIRSQEPLASNRFLFLCEKRL